MDASADVADDAATDTGTPPANPFVPPNAPSDRSHLAAFGYVVASVDYDQNPVGLDQYDIVESLALAIDMMTGEPPGEVGDIVDASRIASAGHSIGAKAAI